MSAKLVEITPNPPVSPAVAELLNELTQWVEDGKVSSLAVAVVHRDGSTSTGWSSPATLATLVGAVERVKYRLIEAMGE